MNRSDIGRRSKQRGRSIERDWAKALGTIREAGRQGSESGQHGADIILPPYYIEVKSLLGMKTLIKLLAEAESETPTDGVPVLGLTLRDAKPGHRDWVCLPRSCFVDWHVNRPPDPHESLTPLQREVFAELGFISTDP